MSFTMAIGGIGHEANTYHPRLTELGDYSVYRGPEIPERFAGANTAIGGMLAAAADLGAAVVPTLFAIAEASGVTSRAAYASLKAELLERLAAAIPVDAIALELHGAAIVEGLDDVETDLGRAVRSLVGSDVKIVAAFDLHGNLTQETADALDLVLGNHFYPETDMALRGYEAVSLLPRLLAGELRPATHVEFVPMLITSGTSTDAGPAAAVNEACFAMERRAEIVDCVFFHGYVWADSPRAGARIIVTTNDDAELARASARRVAERLWSLREEFRCTLPEPAEAVAQALAVDGGPVVLGDYADNPGGGAPGDGTHLLRAMLDARLESACFGFMYDPEVARIAHEVGVGSRIKVELGGKHLELHGPPIALTCHVKSLTDGRFTYQAVYRGLEEDLGRMARLQIDGLDILVASKRNQTFDAEVFLLHGIDVSRYKVVGLKGCDHYRAGFADLAKEMIAVDSPGLVSARIERFPRTSAPVPLWPLDPGASYPVAAVAQL